MFNGFLFHVTSSALQQACSVYNKLVVFTRRYYLLHLLLDCDANFWEQVDFELPFYFAFGFGGLRSLTVITAGYRPSLKVGLCISDVYFASCSSLLSLRDVIGLSFVHTFFVGISNVTHVY